MLQRRDTVAGPVLGILCSFLGLRFRDGTSARENFVRYISILPLRYKGEGGFLARGIPEHLRL